MTGEDAFADQPTPAPDGEEFVLDVDEEFLVDLDQDDAFVLEDEEDQVFLIADDELVSECEEEMFVLDETRAGGDGAVLESEAPMAASATGSSEDAASDPSGTDEVELTELMDGIGLTDEVGLSDDDSLTVFDESFEQAEDPAPSLEGIQGHGASSEEEAERPGVLPDLSEWAELPDEPAELPAMEAGAAFGQESAAEDPPLVEVQQPEFQQDSLQDAQDVVSEDEASQAQDWSGDPAAEETFEDLVKTFAANDSEEAEGEPSLGDEIETAWYGLETGGDQAAARSGSPKSDSQEDREPEQEVAAREAASHVSKTGLDDADWFMADSAQELAASPSHEDASLAEEWSDDLVGLGADGFDAVGAPQDLAAFEQASATSTEEAFAPASDEATDDGWDTEFPDLEGTSDVSQGEEWEDDLARLRAEREESPSFAGGRRMWLPAAAAALLLAGCWAAWEMLQPLAKDLASTGRDVAVVPPTDTGTPGDAGTTTDPGASTEDPATGTGDAGTADPETGTADPNTDPAAADPDPNVGDPDPDVTPDPDLGATQPPVDVAPSDPAPADPVPDVASGNVAATLDPEKPAVTVSPASWTGSTASANGEAAIVEVLTSNNELVSLRPGETIVELPNGHYFKGRMKRLRKGKLTLADGRAEYTFDLSEVRILDAADPEYRTVQEMPRASVTLANGQRIRGRLVKETENHVVLAYETGRVMVPRVDVKSVSFTGRVHF